MDNKEQVLDNFIEEYNLLTNVPDWDINRDICEQYRKEHPRDFKNVPWSITKHRKRVMDWLPKHRYDLKKALNNK